LIYFKNFCKCHNVPTAQQLKKKDKKETKVGRQWLTPVTLVTQEAEMKATAVQS
jgi:hypothetical protein